MIDFNKSLPGITFLPPLIVSALFIFVIACGKKFEAPKPEISPVDTIPTPFTWVKPTNFPDPVYDISRNPLTEEGIELGRFLFYDGILSRTNQIGCGTCHQQVAAFTHHGHELSHGVDDLLGIRNSPSIQNLAWNPSFFWDGGVHDLDLVPFNPIENPVEMDEKVASVITKLQNTPLSTSKIPVDYPAMFEKAFGSKEINTERMMKALSQFMLTLVSANSKYDYYVNGDASAFNALEKEGMSIFKAKCTSCHAGELFTDYSFRNNGLIPARIDDKGRYEISAREEDKYKFKVPSLRNVGLTAPYMHDGRFQTLQQVLDHYSNKMQKMATLDPILISSEGKAGIALTTSDKQALTAFLLTLSDDQFIKEAKFADPGIGNAF